MTAQEELEKLKSETKKNSTRIARKNATVGGTLAITALISIILFFVQRAEAERARMEAEHQHEAYMECSTKMKAMETQLQKVNDVLAMQIEVANEQKAMAEKQISKAKSSNR